MKKFATTLLLIFTLLSNAQDVMIIHTATPANTFDYVTYINDPHLNGNPDAKFVFKHTWGDNGSYNNKAQGIFYTGYEWAIFNEDLSDMEPGKSYFIYIPNNPNAIFRHLAFGGNNGSFPNTTVFDDPLLNGQNPGPIAIADNVIIQGGIYNDKPFSFYYDTALGKRGLYINDMSMLEDNFQFDVMILNDTQGATGYRHEAISGTNISGNYTYIDHPDLNGNSNAGFVFSQYWGANGPSSEVEITTELGARYSSTEGKWGIYLEDSTLTMPSGAILDIIMLPTVTLAQTQFNKESKLVLAPNPVNDYVNLSTQDVITEVVIYNILGQEVLRQANNGNSMQIDLSSFPSGNYITKVQVGNVIETIKLIKQ